MTPEAVVLDVERAGVASRLLAITIDFIALGIVWGMVAWFLLSTFGEVEGVSGAVLAIVGSLGMYLAWFCGFETAIGRTPGKAALGLRVVGTDGTPVRFVQAFLRAIIGIVDFLLVPVGFVAVVSCLLSPRDQRLGDVAAGTLVVRDRTAVRLVTPARFPVPYGYEAYVSSLDVGAMTEGQYGVLRNFLLRAHQLSPLARAQMAVRLANPISRVLRHDPPRNLHPETFLVCVVAAWQQAHADPAPPLPTW
ncbi:MAG TPA: RDD family protein [Acidimicrobiales bacterium]